MNGSEKQITWATRIKNETLAELDGHCTLMYVGRDLCNRGYGDAEMASLGIATEDEADAFCAKVGALAGELADGKTSASWWIDEGWADALIELRNAAMDRLAPRRN